MIYSIDIDLDCIIREKVRNDFTLTVNAVNDAPVLLQPLEGSEIVGTSGAAAMVLYQFCGSIDHPIFKFL